MLSETSPNLIALVPQEESNSLRKLQPRSLYKHSSSDHDQSALARPIPVALLVPIPAFSGLLLFPTPSGQFIPEEKKKKGFPERINTKPWGFFGMAASFMVLLLVVAWFCPQN